MPSKLTADFSVIQLHPKIVECITCEEPVVMTSIGPSYGIAFYEGEPVPHDWKGGWGGFTCCWRCHAEFELVQADDTKRREWFRQKRRLAKMRKGVEPRYVGDLV
jgi:hypothetical protein